MEGDSDMSAELQETITGAAYQRIFESLCENRQEALALYNALAGTQETDPENIRIGRRREIWTLGRKDGAVFTFFVKDPEAV